MSEELTSMVNSDGSFTEGWKDSLPEEIRDNVVLDKYEDFPNMIKGLANAQSKLGTKMEQLPSTDSTPEEWDEFYGKMGRPEDATKYDFKDRNMPENLHADEKQLEEFKGKAHELGLNNNQALELLKWYDGSSVEAMTAQQEAMQLRSDEEYNNLQKEWGNSFDKNVSSAKIMMEQLGAKEMLQETGLDDSPAVAKLLYKFSSLVSEDRLKGGGNDITMNAGIQNEIKSLQVEQMDALKNGDRTKGKEIASKLHGLYQSLDS